MDRSLVPVLFNAGEKLVPEACVDEPLHHHTL